MSKMIFVNLPVANLPKSKAFYEAIGFTNNPQFTDETAACMVLTDAIYVMLETHEKFAQLTTREIADSHKTAQFLLALSCDSREAVDEITAAGLHLRTWGDAYGYALVASGRAEAMVDVSAELYDLAPVPVIMAEAGGRFTDLTGAIDPGGGSGLATNGNLGNVGFILGIIGSVLGTLGRIYNFTSGAFSSLGG